MTLRTSALFPAAILSVLAGCGGGDGGMVASAPAPGPVTSPTSTPTTSATGATDKIIAGASASGGFAEQGVPFNSTDNVEVFYDAATGTYSVTTPADTTPAVLSRDPNYTPPAGEPWLNFVSGNGIYFLARASAQSSDPAMRYSYSNLAAWGYHDGSLFGTVAFGVITPASAIPRSGRATYSGFMEGRTTEKFADNLVGGMVNGGVTGKVALNFDFGVGGISGQLSPVVEGKALPDMQVTNYNWPLGAASFSSELTQSMGPSRLNGTFTGPAAQELIGGFMFWYTSPNGAGAQQADGALLAKKN